MTSGACTLCGAYCPEQDRLDTCTHPRCPSKKQPTGYHRKAIPKGVFGEGSKVIEEAAEFADALDQVNPVMALCELSDLIGAIQGYLTKYHPSVTIDDLITMADATRRAFESGQRS